MNERPQLHISGLNLLASCGIAFEFRYLRNVKRPPGVAALVGHGTDKAANADLREKMEQARLLAEDVVTDIAAEAVKERWKEEPPLLLPDEKAMGKRAAKGAAVDKAVRLTKAYHGKAAPLIEPLGIQEPWSINLDDQLAIRGHDAELDLVGTTDVRERFFAVRKLGLSAALKESQNPFPIRSSIEAVGIRDLKTTGKTPNANVAHLSEQLTAYALGVKVRDGKMPQRLALDYLVDLKRAVEHRIFETYRTPKDVAAFIDRVAQAVKVIKAGAFMPAKPDDWMCSEKYCGYFPICPYAKRPKAANVPSLVQIQEASA